MIYKVILILDKFFFTNISLQEIVDLCVEFLFSDKSNIDGFTITDFDEILTFITSESLVLFDGEYHKQIDAVEMGSLLGTIFLMFFLVIMNKFGSKIVIENINLSFMKDTLMTPSCYFEQKIILKNIDVTLITKILILSLHLR